MAMTDYGASHFNVRFLCLGGSNTHRCPASWHMARKGRDLGPELTNTLQISFYVLAMTIA